MGRPIAEIAFILIKKSTIDFLVKVSNFIEQVLHEMCTYAMRFRKGYPHQTVVITLEWVICQVLEPECVI